MKTSGRKILSLLLIMIFLSNVFAGDILAKMSNSLEERVSSEKDGGLKEEREFQEISAAEEERKGKISDSAVSYQAEMQPEQVRVIVELKGEPVIYEAIRSGVSYAELSQTIIEEREAEIAREQSLALKDLDNYLSVEEKTGKDEGISESKIISYSTGLNGFAATVKSQDIAQIEKKPYVKRVYISEEYQRPQLKHSHQMIGSSYAWETKGLKGEGTVIAVIDTGVDVSHPAMTLKDSSKTKYKAADVAEMIRENELKGKYYTEKVPYGYNYYDHNENILDSYGYMHGMHVAGIVAANRKDGAEINGVAPNAQILALKVFSDDIQYPTTFTDVWLKAFDDAIILKADVINMSLGAAAGLASDDMARPENEAFRRAREAGIVVAVSAGNDRNIVFGNQYGVKALAENPDTALISSPSLIDSSISVASLENGVKHTTNVYWTRQDGQVDKARINIKMGIKAADVITGTAIHIGYGDDEDYQNKDVEDKVILLELYPQQKKENEGHTQAFTASTAAIQVHHSHEHQHRMTLEQRIRLAESKNPRAILLYNDKESGEQLGRDLNVLAPLFKKSLAIVGYIGGQKIIEALEANGDLELRLSSVLEAEASPEEGTLSVFTSWGPTPDLRIKPEITAPGGNIYSSVEDNQYKNMSGTSMASPHVAGAAAILKQFLKEQGQDESSVAEEIKLRLMNTAKPVKDKDGQIDFVRKQGAGLMQLDKALATEVLVKATGSNDLVKDGKLELKELENGEFHFNLAVENRSDKARVFAMSMLGMVERKEEGRLSEKSHNLSNFGNLSDTLHILPNEQREFSFRIDFSEYREIERESFVEGYIFLKDISKDGEKIDLNVPFLAYYGDWGMPKAIDAFGIREINEKEHRNAQFMVNKDNHSRSSMFATPMGLGLPIIRNTLYFLPDLGKTRTVDFHGTFGVRIAPLRNMSRMEYSILDAKTKETLKVLGESKEIRKLSRLGMRPSYVYMPESLWNGDLNGKQVSDDRDLIYQIKATLNNSMSNPQVQIYQYPLKADTTAPIYSEQESEKIKLEEYSGNRKKLSFTVKDTNSGLANIYVQSMHFRKREVDENGEHRLATVEEIGENPNFDVWKPFYGKAIKVSFEQPEVNANNGQPILRVIDGKLTIPESYLPQNITSSGKIFCDINGHENKEIQLEMYYDTDDPYIGVFAVDRLDNQNIKYLATNADLRYRLFFLQYNNIISNQGKIMVNEKSVDEESLSLSGKADVKIEFPNPNIRIKFLKISNNGENDILISNGQIQDKGKEKYGLTLTGTSYRFAVEAKVGEVAIYSDVEIRGKSLSFGGVDFSKFRDNQLQVKMGQFHLTKITSVATEVNVEPNSEVQVAGNLLPSHKVKRVYLKNTEFGYPITVDKVSTQKDFFDYPNAYLIQGDRIFIRFKMIGSLELNVVFEGDPDDEDDDFDDLFSEKVPKERGKKKYPVIFLRSPSLLEMKKAGENESKAITVSGFIGYTDEEIESLTVSLIDKKGNPIATPISYPVDQLVRQEIRYVPAKEVIYHDQGYEFSLELESTKFLTNIRVEATTKSGQKASIVRRMFFDDQLPSLAYSIDSRKLNEDFMTLQVNAKDNSFKVRVYQNGSYLGGKDLSRISLEKDEVRYTQDWKLPLKVGQNQISLKVVDAAGQESVKVLYVYRTEK